jgi:hypothetical protein
MQQHMSQATHGKKPRKTVIMHRKNKHTTHMLQHNTAGGEDLMMFACRFICLAASRHRWCSQRRAPPVSGIQSVSCIRDEFRLGQLYCNNRVNGINNVLVSAAVS